MKLQIKLHSARLNNIPWDQKLSPEEENFWKIKLTQFVRFRDLSAPRCTTPLRIPLWHQINLSQWCQSSRWWRCSLCGSKTKRWFLDLQPAIIQIKIDESNCTKKWALRSDDDGKTSIRCKEISWIQSRTNYLSYRLYHCYLLDAEPEHQALSLHLWGDILGCIWMKTVWTWVDMKI